MPDYDATTLEKIVDLQALSGGERRPSEIVAIYWPSGTKVYASAMYTQLPWWPNLVAEIAAEFGSEIPITLTLIPNSSPFIDLPRAASVSDDSINLTFADLDNEFSDLLMEHGEGIRVNVYGYWPAVDLLLSMWRGSLHAPKDMNRSQVKISAVAGWRSPNMLVPRRPHATSCPFIFGAHLSTQAEIDAHKGCPYNVHIGGSIGVPGFTDCPRRTKAQCVERLATEVFWPGFETRPDPIPNNQTQGPNLLARAIGNESNLNNPIRVIFGERYIKSANLLAFRNETNTNHPDEGFFAGLFEFCEGPVLSLFEFRMMGEIVGSEHYQLKRGELGQSPSDWSPDVNSYSGTAHGYGRIEGEPDNATASDYSASVRCLGLRDIRVYTDADTYTEAYTKNRAWCLLELLANLRWGYGQDYPRYDIDSFIDAAAWCDELVSLTDPNGNTFSGVRSTFNAEVNGRAIQQQVKDICTAGRLGLPFEFNGKDVLVPLRSEDTDDPGIPVFSDEGAGRNIVYDNEKSSLQWSYISDDTLTNQWTVNFDDASNGGVDTQILFGDQPQQLRAGRAWGDRTKRVVNKSQAAFGITSLQEVARLGMTLLYLGPLDSGGILNPWSVRFTTWYTHALLVQNYKLIRVTNTKLQSRIAAYFTARGLEPYPGADYTLFRVMKYTRKGDLRVEIEAQLYATLEEGPAEPDEVECGPVLFEALNFMESVVGEVHSYAETSPSGCPITDFGNSCRAQSVPVMTIDGESFEFQPRSYGSDYQAQMFVFLSPLDDPAPDHNWFSSGECSFANGGYHLYGFDVSTDGSEWRIWGLSFVDISGPEDWCEVLDPVHSGPVPQFQYNSNTVIRLIRRAGSLVLSVPADAPDFDLPVGVWTVVGDRAEYTYSTPLTDTDEFIGHSAASGALFNRPAVDPAPANAPVRLVVVGIGAADITNPDNQPGITDVTFCSPGGAVAIGPPRDFAVMINHTTGLVHFHWAPPAVHPELVTGYTLFESDGVTVVMPTTNVSDYEITLAPGTYTYRLNATDGVDVSGFVSVTFTVNEPPVTGIDLFVVDDITLENVLEDLKLEQVTA